MKRLLVILLAAMLMLVPTGCGQMTAGQTVDGPTFYVDVVPECGFEFYGLRYEYYLEDTAYGAAEAYKKDGTAFENGQPIATRFTEREFPKQADLSQFSIEFKLKDKDENWITVENRVPIEAEYAKRYQVVIEQTESGSCTARYESEPAVSGE